MGLDVLSIGGGKSVAYLHKVMIPPALPSHLRDAAELPRHGLRAHFHGIAGERGDVGLVSLKCLEHVGELRLGQLLLCAQVERPAFGEDRLRSGIHALRAAEHRIEHLDDLRRFFLPVKEVRLPEPGIGELRMRGDRFVETSERFRPVAEFRRNRREAVQRMRVVGLQLQRAGKKAGRRGEIAFVLHVDIPEDNVAPRVVRHEPQRVDELILGGSHVAQFLQRHRQVAARVGHCRIEVEHTLVDVLRLFEFTAFGPLRRLFQKPARFRLIVRRRFLKPDGGHAIADLDVDVSGEVVELLPDHVDDFGSGKSSAQVVRRKEFQVG